jgi:hypothetical protein
MNPWDHPDFDHRIVTKILTKDQLAAIGSVAVESTICEEQVDELIWRLSGMKEIAGRFFTHTMSMQPKLDLLAELGKPQLRSEKRLKEFTKLISDLKEANLARNVAVHGKWLTNGTGVFQVLEDGPEAHSPAIAHKLSKKGEVTAQKSAADLQSIAKLLARLDGDLRSFSRSWRRVPSPSKQIEQYLAQTRNPDQTSPKTPARKPRPKASPA